MREAAALAGQNAVVRICSGKAGNRRTKSLTLLHAFQDEVDAVLPGPFHATQGWTHIILLTHLGLSPFNGDTVVAAKRLSPCLILVGPPRQHFLADHRLSDYVLKEIRHLPWTGKSTQ